jgi:preprotein translocase subunit SecA
MNSQRKVVFEQRREFMRQESVRETIDDMRHGVSRIWSLGTSRRRPIPSSGTPPRSRKA